jgi:hypothetical protein
MVSTPRSLSKIIAGARFVHQANRVCRALFNSLVDIPRASDRSTLKRRCKHLLIRASLAKCDDGAGQGLAKIPPTSINMDAGEFDFSQFTDKIVFCNNPFAATLALRILETLALRILETLALRILETLALRI